MRPAGGPEHSWLFWSSPPGVHKHSASLTTVSKGSVQGGRWAQVTGEENVGGDDVEE